MNDAERQEPGIKEYILAGYPMLFLPTREPLVAEQRVKDALLEVEMGDTDLGIWKVTEGLIVTKPNGTMSPQERAKDLIDALAVVEKATEPIVALFHNVRQFVANYQIIQAMIDAAMAARTIGSHIILVGPHLDLPAELKSLITYVECPLPTRPEIQDQYQKITNAYRTEIDVPEDEEEYEELLRHAATAAVGMDGMGAENAIALSMATCNSVDIPLIQSQKRQDIKKSDVLEFIMTSEDMADVGGFSEYKSWMGKRKRVFTDEAREYGLPYPKGVLIVGPAGCTDGSTKIRFRRGNRNSGRIYTIEDAYHKFNQIPRKGLGQGEHRSGDRYLWVDTSISTQCLALTDEGTLQYHDVAGIVYSGVKEVYEVTVSSGRRISVTFEHPFKVPEGQENADDDGFVRLMDLSVGDNVMLRDSSPGKGREVNSRKGRKIMYGLHYHPYAWREGSHKSQSYARLVIEAEVNNLEIADFIFILRTNAVKAQKLSFIPEGMAVHHKDEDFTNDLRDNLEVMTKMEHDTLHGYNNMKNFRFSTVLPEEIVSIISKGETATYDVVMYEPYRNYLAEDFVVHNTGKSLVAKATSAYLGMPLLRLDMGKVFRSLVGESEAAIRMALQVAEAVSPVVLWLDEIEKGLAGAKGSGEMDSGVTARVVSTILTWRQETKYPVMLVATANDVQSIPGMVYRKGRLDEVWATDLPTTTEREEIYKIHIRKRKRDPANFDTELLANSTDTYTGAEIEASIEDAMFAAFDLGVEVSTIHILMAIKECIPAASRDVEEIKVIREWVAQRARLVSGVDAKKQEPSGEKVRKISPKGKAAKTTKPKTRPIR